MKALALILPALAAASPLKAREDDPFAPIYCNGWLMCPLGYRCVPRDPTCVVDCEGYCYRTGTGIPTVTLPTASVPTASVPTATGLPTTNVVPRATMAPRNGGAPSNKQPSPEKHRRADGGGDDAAELTPLPYDPDTLKHWGDKLFKYRPCGGLRPAPPCPGDQVCISAPWGPGCGLACDGPGICVEPVMCAGFANIPCPNEDDICIDWPNDGCDPRSNGVDCAGICI